MRQLNPLFSSLALALALSQPLLTAQAEEQPAVAPAPVAAPAPAAPQSPADAARAKADERRAALDAQRKQRYAELRARAAEIGVDMPEMPPWEAPFPAMDDPAMQQWQADVQARRQARQEEIERFQKMTPEERRAAHEERWQKMQADAAARGMEVPEMPAWEDVDKRHREMTERFEKYRQTVDQFTEEQREAARAVFGRSPMRRSHPDCDHDRAPREMRLMPTMPTMPAPMLPPAPPAPPAPIAPQ